LPEAIIQVLYPPINSGEISGGTLIPAPWLVKVTSAGQRSSCRMTSAGVKAAKQSRWRQLFIAETEHGEHGT